MDATQMRRAIARKREGEALESATWAEIVAGFTVGLLDDAQMAALAMACVWRGLSLDETVAVAQAMVDSGDTVRIGLERIVLDKHSSGGVGDTVSLVVVPMVAGCGVPVAKLSGRALGHTGGTLDKLEAIPGFRTDLDPETFAATVRKVGCAIAAQSERLVPADRRFYTLRDHTGTVPSVGLIAASIVSKKIAGGADAIVFDVKAGRGAFMQDAEEARRLAETLVEVARRLGRRASAIVSDMEQPLSPAIGTGLEVLEARDFLAGERREAPLLEVALEIGEAMLRLGGVDAGRGALQASLDDGSAYQKFLEMLEAQDADLGAFAAMRWPMRQTAVCAKRAGYVTGIDTVAIGEAARSLVEEGDSLAGIRLQVRIGERLEAGQAIAALFEAPEPFVQLVERAITIEENPAPLRPLILARVG